VEDTSNNATAKLKRKSLSHKQSRLDILHSFIYCLATLNQSRYHSSREQQG